MMALYRATVKNKVWTNGVRLEKGMSVEFVYGTGGAPLQTNGGKEVVDAFMQKYGVDIKKACAVSSAYIDLVKIG